MKHLKENKKEIKEKIDLVFILIPYEEYYQPIKSVINSYGIISQCVKTRTVAPKRGVDTCNLSVATNILR